jgi:Ca2+-binding EF-hand superfamily protein
MANELKWDQERCKKEYNDAYQFLLTMGLDHDQSRSSFKSEEILQYRDAFRRLDVDGDGVISTSDLKALFTSLGKKSAGSEETLRAVIAEADFNKNGVVDFNEFLEVRWLRPHGKLLLSVAFIVVNIFIS